VLGAEEWMGLATFGGTVQRVMHKRTVGTSGHVEVALEVKRRGEDGMWIESNRPAEIEVVMQGIIDGTAQLADVVVGVEQSSNRDRVVPPRFLPGAGTESSASPSRYRSQRACQARIRRLRGHDWIVPS